MLQLVTPHMLTLCATVDCRLAMMGFLTSLAEEFWTGKGTLQQIGIATPSVPVLATLIVLAGGATLFGTVQTLVKAQTGQLAPR